MGSVNSCDPDSITFLLVTGEDINTNEPQLYKESTVSKDATNWLMDMNKEIQSLDKNETWDLVPLL